MTSFAVSAAGLPREMLKMISDWPEYQTPDINRCKVDGVAVPVEGWVHSFLSAKRNALAFWPNRVQQVDYIPPSEVVTFWMKNVSRDPTVLFARLDALAFTVVAFDELYNDAWIDAGYPRWGFGRSMISHGWGCAFRGAGHDRLVSRRWLDFGPWRVIRRPDDTTFIQFHDLAITDPAAAYAQAAPGHERMGIAATGGYIAWHNENLLTGARRISRIYFPETNKIEIVVGLGNTVSQGEMICQCAERLQHRLTPPQTDRIDHVAYIFMERADAEAHLHELWLRELECWYVDGSGKHRLDLDYHPVPNPPAWVRALDDK